jgi:hypothetical protein
MHRVVAAQPGEAGIGVEVRGRRRRVEILGHPRALPVRRAFPQRLWPGSRHGKAERADGRTICDRLIASQATPKATALTSGCLRLRQESPRD